ncbi:MAG: Dabb family protein [Bacillota bacterium]|nr:Dabb family protein [Bacillota bacterium]
MKNDEIRHTVVFCLKHEKGSEEAEKFLRDGKEVLSAIPGAYQFESLWMVSEDGGYDYAFSMRFENQQAYDDFIKHGNHMEFVKQRCKKEVSKFKVMDFCVI